jgi:hypothetical protein
MHRRRFIQLTTTTAALLFAQLQGCGPTQQESTLSEPDFLKKVAEPASIKRIGAEYIKQNPTESSPETLTEALLMSIPSTEQKAIEEGLLSKIQSDFEQGRTVTLEGWIISVTEARQCAFLSIL